MKIYTKTGDKGKTSLFDGSRVSKDDIRVETYGTIDELNAAIGLCVSFINKELDSGRVRSPLAGMTKVREHLILIQNDLFEIGACLANPTAPGNPRLITQLHDNTLKSEQLIDDLTAKLPELFNFILPGGSHAASFLQLARTVSRRAERRVVSLSHQQRINNEILIYLNRLSDLFHVMSRFVNFSENQKEIIWKSKVG